MRNEKGSEKECKIERPRNGCQCIGQEQQVLPARPITTPTTAPISCQRPRRQLAATATNDAALETKFWLETGRELAVALDQRPRQSTVQSTALWLSCHGPHQSGVTFALALDQHLTSTYPAPDQQLPSTRPSLDHHSSTTRPPLEHHSTTTRALLDHHSTTTRPPLDHHSTTARPPLAPLLLLHLDLPTPYAFATVLATIDHYFASNACMSAPAYWLIIVHDVVQALRPRKKQSGRRNRRLRGLEAGATRAYAGLEERLVPAQGWTAEPWTAMNNSALDDWESWPMMAGKHEAIRDCHWGKPAPFPPKLAGDLGTDEAEAGHSRIMETAQPGGAHAHTIFPEVPGIEVGLPQSVPRGVVESETFVRTQDNLHPPQDTKALCIRVPERACVKSQSAQGRDFVFRKSTITEQGSARVLCTAAAAKTLTADRMPLT
ncbi:hypothetical protein Purlil1_2918 [Purpureocillium lilacinum]|uniref:Uncharacterized protein n=1 Tax=Purpureocillium lilacinum TaxID=33203 RepID=A0ABR0CAN5_PURLI|nr:hypothetical protein Purlil1_2918 [Purpureocillium lilacinum]